MATVQDLGRQVKAKYPGQYDDLDDVSVGQKVKAKFPGSYDDFSDAPARPTPADVKAKFQDFAPAQDPKWKMQPFTEAAGGFNDTVKSAASLAPKNWKEAAVDAVFSPLARPVAAMIGSHVDQAKQAMDPRRGAVERAGHALATVTPGGPFAAQIGETLPENPARAAGMAAAGGAMAAAPKIAPAAARGAQTAARTARGAAQGAWQGVGQKSVGGAAIGSGLGYMVGGPHGAGVGASIGGALPSVEGAIQGGMSAYRNAPPPPPPFERFVPKAKPTPYGGPTAPFDEGATRLPPRTPAALPQEGPPQAPAPSRPNPAIAAKTRFGGQTAPFDEGARRLPPATPATPPPDGPPPPPVDVKFKPGQMTKRNMPTFAPGKPQYGPPSRIIPRQSPMQAPPVVELETKAVPQAPPTPPASASQGPPTPPKPTEAEVFNPPEGSAPGKGTKESVIKGHRTVRGKVFGRFFRDEAKGVPPDLGEWKLGDPRWKKVADAAGTTPPNTPEALQILLNEVKNTPPRGIVEYAKGGVVAPMKEKVRQGRRSKRGVWYGPPQGRK